MVSAPGEQPCLHVLTGDVVVRLNLAVRLPHLCQQAFLISHVGFNRIRNQEVRAAAGRLRQLGQPTLDFRFQANAEGCAPCVRHEHIIARFDSGTPLRTDTQ